MKDIICFIDDSAFEHDLLKNEIAPTALDTVFIQGYTFDEIKKLLAGKTPSLFLLDLWGQDPGVTHPYLTPATEVRQKTAGFPTLDQVYNGLDNFEGDVNNEFLKRFFSIVDCWRNLFEEICAKIGQNGKYGLGNLARVRDLYPGTPAVFYTRKSLISDAVAMFKAGADGLFIKPSGKNDPETRRLTREYAPRLLKELKQVMTGLNTAEKNSE